MLATFCVAQSKAVFLRFLIHPCTLFLTPEVVEVSRYRYVPGLGGGGGGSDQQRFSVCQWLGCTEGLEARVHRNASRKGIGTDNIRR